MVTPGTQVFLHVLFSCSQLTSTLLRFCMPLLHPVTSVPRRPSELHHLLCISQTFSFLCQLPRLLSISKEGIWLSHLSGPWEILDWVSLSPTLWSDPVGLKCWDGSWDTEFISHLFTRPLSRGYERYSFP